MRGVDTSGVTQSSQMLVLQGNAMKLKLTAVLLTLAAAFAGPTCNVPKEKWMNEGEFKASLEKQGYQIKTFKVSKGNCYEIYGHDKAGKKVEIYFDPSNGTPLESK
jgi:hypothetical protein